jgi:Ca2+ transporting ATPase
VLEFLELSIEIGSILCMHAGFPIWHCIDMMLLILQLEFPAQLPCLLHIAMCSALCNESVLQYNPDKGNYEKIGESTEVALRVLTEKVRLQISALLNLSSLPNHCGCCLFLFLLLFLCTSFYHALVYVRCKLDFVASCFQVGLPGFDSMPSALNMLSSHERASYCNHYWENQFKKVCFVIVSYILCKYSHTYSYIYVYLY